MKNTVKTVSFMMIATLFSKVAGLFRDILIAAKYGTESIEAVAYSYASSLPVQLFDFTLGAAVLATFIPIFNGHLERGDRKRAMDFSNNFINIILLISMLISVLGMVFSSQIGHFIAPDLDAETQALLQKLIVIVLPTTVFTALAYSFVGILQSMGEFNITAIISLVSNLVIIIYMFFFDNIYGLCIAMLVGWALQFVVQIPALFKKQYKYKFTLNFRDPDIKEAAILALPVLVSSWLQPITVFINKRYASSIVGAAPALDYANRFYIIVVGVFVFAITNYIFPALSKKIGVGDREGFGDLVCKSIRAMILIIAPIMVAMSVLSDSVIQVVYGRGQFTEYSVNLTSVALKYYTFGMVSYGVNEILNKCFYSVKKPKIPMISSLIGIVTTIIISYISINVFNLGVMGLAISSAVSTIIVSVILILFMQKDIKFFNKNLIVHFFKVALSVAVMGIAVFAINKLLYEYNVLLKLALSVVFGAIIYFIMLSLLRVKELREVLK